MPLVCPSIMEDSEEEFLKHAGTLDSEILEIRADGLRKCSKESVHSLLSKIKKSTKSKIILTLRKKDEGGAFRGTEDERVDILLGCLHLADLVDIELRSEICNEVVSKARANKIGVIISYHDFSKTPERKEILRIIEKEIKAGADYAKVAFKANSPADVLELLRITHEMSKKTDVISMSMGELGRISRIASPFFGSKITYAAVGKSTAPGQLSFEETKKILESLGV